jgi:hypothetical protein
MAIATRADCGPDIVIASYLFQKLMMRLLIRLPVLEEQNIGWRLLFAQLGSAILSDSPCSEAT